MKIKVRTFAILKEKMGEEDFELEIPEGKSLAAILADLEEKFRDVRHVLESSAVAINGNLTRRDSFPSEGDEVAILPPASGG